MNQYDVFTRRAAGDDLIHAGSVDAPTDRLATTNAHDIYDEEDWAEMLVVRAEHLLPVTAPDPSAAGETDAEAEASTEGVDA